MKLRLLDWLACPTCGEGSLDIAITRSEERPAYDGHWEPEEEIPGRSLRSVTEVIEGRLRCRDCAATFPVTDGIPRLLSEGVAVGPATGHAWTEFAEAVPEFEQNFWDLLHPLKPEDFMGRLVLDAGCGFGRHAFFATRYGAEVIALDSSPEAVASAARNLDGNMRAHVVQGDIARPPFRKNLFDIVYSLGVLHHVPDPRGAFRALHQHVKPNGRLAIWMYGPRQGMIRIATGALRGASAQMSPDQLHRFSQGIAAGLRVFSHTPHRVLGKVPLVGFLVNHLPVHDHSRWPFEVVVADVYDRLRVPVTGYFTGEELESWYAEAGYADIQVTRRVRNTESFRGLGVRR
jgi:SAM-dependent methyltransferase